MRNTLHGSTTKAERGRRREGPDTEAELESVLEEPPTVE